MESNKHILCTKVITFTSVDLAKIEPPILSEGVRRIIIESGVKSLQGLVGSNPQAAVRNVLQNYWRVK